MLGPILKVKHLASLSTLLNTLSLALAPSNPSLRQLNHPSVMSNHVEHSAFPAGLERICHELMHAAKSFNSLVKIATEGPPLSAIRIPLIQSKPDVVPLRPFKVIYEGPVEHAPHINAILDGSGNLQYNRG